MKSVRIFYTKTGRMKFVSHLDMNLLMTRVIRKADIPVWYTEGFNRHIYINYAVPLSLGFEGVYEVMDIRLTEDAFSLEEMLKRLNAAAPEGIEFLRANTPVLPTAAIFFAEYELTLTLTVCRRHLLVPALTAFSARLIVRLAVIKLAKGIGRKRI